MKDLFKKIVDNGLVLELKDDKLKLFSKSTEVNTELLNDIKANKEALIQYLRENSQDVIHNSAKETIPVLKQSESYLLSSSQKRLWILSQFEQSNSAYNMPGVFVFEGQLDIAALETSFQSIIHRHEILRTNFKENKEGEVRQYITSLQDVNFKISFLDLQNHENKDQEVENIVYTEANESFDLSQDLLLRAKLLQLENDKFIFSVTMHHIISDGWSMELMVKEILTLYNAIVLKQENPLQELRIQYKDYAAWQQKQLQNEQLDGHKSYWLKQFEGEISTLELPTDRPRPVVKTFNGGEVVTKINLKSSVALKDICRQEDCTLFMGLLASVNTLLFKYTEQKDIIIGIPIAGRNHVELENQIGFYVNTLALRARFDGEDSYIQLLRNIKQLTLDAYQHQLYPFDELVGELDLIRDSSRNPLFDVMVLQEEKYGQNEFSLSMDKVKISNFSSSKNQLTKFDLSFNFSENEECISISLDYNSDLFDKETISRLGEHLEKIIDEAVSDPEKSLNQINFISNTEKNQLINDFNNRDADYPKEKTLVELFEEQVNLDPQKTALVFNDKKFTFRELNEKSNQLAHYLKSNYSIEPNHLIGIKLERSEHLIISILGVLKSGAAYVPIDPEYPQERIDYILKDSQCKLLIDEIELSKFSSVENRFPTTNQKTKLRFNDLVYVIYTSGSTGKPKGCLIEHQGIINRIDWMWKEFGYDSNDIILQKTTFTFDVSVWEIFMPLCWGACMVLCQDEDVKSPERILHLIQTKKITSLHFVPSMLNVFVQKLQEENDSAGLLKSLRNVITSGEALLLETVKKWYQITDVVIHNLYGPTEASIDVTFHTTSSSDSIIPIGAPINNTQIYILDQQQNILPIGVIGEICIGGDGLAHGYINKAELTNEKFIANPHKANSRIYRTGDRGRWLPNGSVEYLGRKDDQVKIRGFRIELGEIENALRLNAKIEDAVVLAKELLTSEKELVAYLVCNSELNISELRSELGKKIPAYMIPNHYVNLEQLPLTPNGKLDKKALPSPIKASVNTGAEYVAPRNQIEEELIKIWQSVLGKDQIGVKDNFFVLGGDSIKSIQIVSKMKQLDLQISVADVFMEPILENLAKLVTRFVNDVDQGLETGSVLLNPIQHFFFEKIHTDIHHFNQSVLLKSTDRLDDKIISEVFIKLTEHHDALRLRYKKANGNWSQEYSEPDKTIFSLDTFDLRDSFDELQDLKVHGEALQAGLNIENGPLIKLGLFQMQDADRLLIVIHHLIIDGVSWRILFEDFASLYEQIQTKSIIKLPLKTTSFKSWMENQAKYANSEVLQKELKYWQEIENTQVQSISLDVLKGENLCGIKQTISFEVARDSIQSFVENGAKHLNTDINSLLISCLGVAIQKTFGINKTAIYLEGHGREELEDKSDISRTVGWFTSIFPFIVDIEENTKPLAHLIAVKDSLKRIPNKGIGYGLISYLKDEDFDQQISPQIMFNFLGEFDSGIKLGEAQNNVFEFSNEEYGADTSLNQERFTEIDINGMLMETGLNMSITYSSEQYKETTIKAFQANYKEAILQLTEIVTNLTESIKSPGDFTYSSLSINEVKEIESTVGKIEDIYPLSPMQIGLFYHWLVDKSSCLYTDHVSMRISGNMNVDVLKESYQYLIDRYPILRTSFLNNYGDEALQIVKEKLEANFKFIDLSSEAENTETMVLEIKEKEKFEGFDLNKDGQTRLTVIKIRDNEFEFIWSFHHIIMDGWCMGIINEEFYLIYDSLERNKAVELQKPPAFVNYINWLSNVDHTKAKEYWENYLSGYNETTGLPVIQQSSEYIQKTKMFRIDQHTLNDLIDLGAANNITINTIFQGLWGIILSKLNNRRDVVFGSVVSGRPAELVGIEKMIGLFINTVPVRISYDDTTKLIDLLVDLQQNDVKGKEYHYTQLSEIQATNELGTNLFDHILAFENYPTAESVNQVTKDQMSIEVKTMDVFEQRDLNLSIIISPNLDCFEVAIRYNEALYSSNLVEGVIQQFNQLIIDVISSPDKLVSTIDVVTKQQADDILLQFTAPKMDVDFSKIIITQFEEQVAKTPENIALVFDQKQFSYSELNSKANQLAQYLRAKKPLKTGDLVGVMLQRDEWLMITILAILKTGAAYLPIDLEYPKERIEYLIKDSNCSLLIDNNEIELFNQNASSFGTDNPINELTTTDLVYVVYTSGTTGKPKGVMIENKSLINLCNWHINYFSITEKTRATVFSSFSFDAFIFETFPILISGGSIYLINSDDRKEGARIVDLLKRETITHCFLPTIFAENVFSNYISELEHLDCTFMVAGEKLNSIPSKKLKLYNNYGPSENTVAATCYAVDYNRIDIPIGTPNSNVEIYILDNDLHMMPIGVQGEICIGGPSLARGYLNQPELTEEKFVSNPFSKGDKIYKTGDLGRWLPDGNIEFLGRKDDQVKIRGYRVELSEIDTALLEHGEIQQSVTVIRVKDNSDKNLVAYLVSSGKLNISELRMYLSQKLPEYMLPSHYVQLESLPLTPNGKVDKKALPSPQDSVMDTGKEQVAAQNDVEEKLVLTWQEVLGREDVSVKDNFFDLGGDSIKAIQIVSRLKKHGYQIKVIDIISTPVLEEVAQLVKPLIEGISVENQNKIETGFVVLNPMQHFFFGKIKTDIHHFNQSVLLKSTKRLNEQNIHTVFSKLVEHHDALRLRYTNKNNVWNQEYSGVNDAVFSLETFDLRNSSNELEDLNSHGETLQSGLNIANGPLIKLGLFQLSDGDRLLIVVHHLIIDGVSWRILFEDFSSLYQQIQNNQKLDLPFKTSSLKTWMEEQYSYANSEVLKKENVFWETIENTSVQTIPHDFENGTNLSRDKQIISFDIERNQIQSLLANGSKILNADANSLLISCLGFALQQTLGIEKTAIYLEGHGREEMNLKTDISRTVGWFTTIFPFIIEVKENGSVLDQLIAIKDALKRIPNKGIGYGLLSNLSEERLKNKLVPQIIFNFLGEFDSGIKFDNKNNSLEFAKEEAGSEVSLDQERFAEIDIAGILLSTGLNMSFSFSDKQFGTATIEKLSVNYKQALLQLEEILSDLNEPISTSGDFTYKDLTFEDIKIIEEVDGKIEDIYPLSPMQSGLYYHWLIGKESFMYLNQISYRVNGEMNLDVLSASYQYLINRYPILRTSFLNDLGDQPLQIVKEKLKADFRFQDLSLEGDTREKIVLSVKEEDKNEGFDLSKGGQSRLTVLKISSNEYEFIWSFHHILMDGWCLGIINQEFYTVYDALIQNKPIVLPTSPSYVNYINWLSNIDHTASKEYWRNYLQGFSQTTGLPNSGGKEYDQSVKIIQIKDKYAQIEKISKTNNLTINTIIQGVWGILLSKYNNTQDSVFGTIVSGRPAELDGIENMIGLFVNAVPVRVTYNRELKLLDLLIELQQQEAKGKDHHYTQLTEIQKTNELGATLFDHILVFENYPVIDKINDSQKDVEHFSITSASLFEQTNFDFNLIINPSEDELEVQFVYNKFVYDHSLIETISHQFEYLMNNLESLCDQLVADISIVQADERKLLLEDFNETCVQYERTENVLDLFESQALKTPGNISLVFNDKKINYDQLNRKTNQFANYIHSNFEIQAGDKIALLISRSEWSVISMIGIMKLACVFVPIDKEWPESMIQFVVKECGAKLLITDEIIENNEIGELNLLPLDKVIEEMDTVSDVKLDIKLPSDLSSYIIHTSGSTGVPKGVEQTHKMLYNLVKWDSKRAQKIADLRHLQTSSFSFDMSLLDTNSTLASGGELHIIGENLRKDLNGLKNYIVAHQISVLSMSCSALSVLFSEIESQEFEGHGIREIISAGDQLYIKGGLRKFLSLNSDVSIYNYYGPSETHVVTSIKYCFDEGGVPIKSTIGKPIDNSTIYILDQNSQLIPIGAIGEIYIGGSNLAKGYCNKPELTKEKFIPSPFDLQETLYKTGDLGKWLPNGEIEYLHRIDNQVKINGYRIELEEIELTLLDYEEVNEVAVIPVEMINNQKVLVAYIVGGGAQTEIKNYLLNKLPKYMIPSYFILLDKFPLNANGKIDKKALPKPNTVLNDSRVEYLAPSNEIEEKLVSIWEEILQVENIGIAENFFALGGHSLKVMILVSRIMKVFSVKITIETFFEKNTIAQLAAEIDTLIWLNKENEQIITIDDNTENIVF